MYDRWKKILSGVYLEKRTVAILDYEKGLKEEFLLQKHRNLTSSVTTKVNISPVYQPWAAILKGWGDTVHYIPSPKKSTRQIWKLCKKVTFILLGNISDSCHNITLQSLERAVFDDLGGILAKNFFVRSTPNDGAAPHRLLTISPTFKEGSPPMMLATLSPIRLQLD